MRVLAISPHDDDMELGAGGLVARLGDAGYAVAHLIVAQCAREEVRRAACVLDIDDLEFAQLPRRHFSVHRQDLLERFIRIRDMALPDLVLVPRPTDVHQDHQVVAREALRAFKHTCILGYDMVWNQLGDSRLNYYVPLNGVQLAYKIQAIRCYSRIAPYMEEEVIRAIARVRGLQAGVKYAEAFEVLRWIR